VELKIPITIAGMSFGALSSHAKQALGRGASMMGTSTTTGDGGMTPEERLSSRTLVYQLLPSRYGMNPDDLRRADAIEVVVGQGAKPGGGGMLLGHKISDRVAAMRDLPPGIDQRSACRHPDWTGPDDLEIKIRELREITDWQVPIFIKMGASRVFDDVKLAAKAGADVIVVDGMEGGTGASPAILQEHTGIPTLAAVCEARAALEDIGLFGEVQLIMAGGIRDGVDAAKALALGADAVYIGTAALIALNCNRPLYIEDYRVLGTEPHHCHHCHTGRCPVGITTQDPELMKRLDIDEGAERVTNLLRAMTLEMQMLARACGKSDVHHLEPEDMAALSMEASAVCGIPLAGARKIFGR
ncbi:MAG TPA: FMN-binding glutamate synthase family protein, partial [Bryobacteraceae bacterium]|nr:FMN-binding glutamate synthase family protein [Bryobacteraceae bacterium]